jgi:hypothetical protein
MEEIMASDVKAFLLALIVTTSNVFYICPNFVSGLSLNQTVNSADEEEYEEEEEDGEQDEEENQEEEKEEEAEKKKEVDENQKTRGLESKIQELVNSSIELERKSTVLRMLRIAKLVLDGLPAASLGMILLLQDRTHAVAKFFHKFFVTTGVASSVIRLGWEAFEWIFIG